LEKEIHGGREMNLFDKGWECPKCGAVMSPTTSCCVNCRGYGEVQINTNFTKYIENAPFPFVKDEAKESEDTE
jgi:hypothetical protein